MTSPLIADPAETGDILVEAPVPIPHDGAISHDVAKHVVGGTSALSLGVFLERGAGFAANILAARFAGSSTFGAYALGISTANNISTYAAGGIGSTAVRFSGKYPYGSAGYTTLARALVIVSTVSALIAMLALWLGAQPIAHLLHKESLTTMLRWAALSAGGMILLECARGFFVGQRRLVALVLLSVIVGIGMLTLLPVTAAMHRPTHMIVAQGAVTCAAVAICLLFAARLGVAPRSSPIAALPLLPMLREVWGFGVVQLAGLIGANLAGWWLTALVARSDTTLVQMSFFAIASQLRNLAGIAPGLLTEGSYAVMANPDEASRTPHRIMALCTYASTSVALLVSACGILLSPWALRAMYGTAYTHAVATATVALAVAVVHMGNAPAAARLTIVSIKAAGIINTVWAIFVAVSATIFLFHGGSATEAMAILFAGHAVSAALVLAVLSKKDFVPSGMVPLFAVATVSISALATLSVLRERMQSAGSTTMWMALIFFGTCASLLALGKRYHWVPSRVAARRMLTSLRSAVQGILPCGKRRLHAV